MTKTLDVRPAQCLLSGYPAAREVAYGFIEHLMRRDLNLHSVASTKQKRVVWGKIKGSSAPPHRITLGQWFIDSPQSTGQSMISSLGGGPDGSYIAFPSRNGRSAGYVRIRVLAETGVWWSESKELCGTPSRQAVSGDAQLYAPAGDEKQITGYGGCKMGRGSSFEHSWRLIDQVVAKQRF